MLVEPVFAFLIHRFMHFITSFLNVGDDGSSNDNDDSVNVNDDSIPDVVFTTFITLFHTNTNSFSRTNPPKKCSSP